MPIVVRLTHWQWGYLLLLLVFSALFFAGLGPTTASAATASEEKQACWDKFNDKDIIRSRLSIVDQIQYDKCRSDGWCLDAGEGKEVGSRRITCSDPRLDSAVDSAADAEIKPLVKLVCGDPPVSDTLTELFLKCDARVRSIYASCDMTGGPITSSIKDTNENTSRCVRDKLPDPKPKIQEVLAAVTTGRATAQQIIDDTIDEIQNAENEQECVDRGGEWVDSKCREKAGEVETCKVDGVGWIVCPLANFLSNVTDGAYTLAEKLLVFRISDDPWSTDPKVNPIYPIWANVRNFANFAFVIAFFAVVFSQATSIGISAYGVRKMLPRIIAAAILVNLSYYICLLGIDISNIVGAGLDGIIKSTTNGLTPPKDGTWETFMSSVLAGGTSLVVLGAAAVWATGPVFAIMVFSFLAILTALAIFLARHALIIMLIILSPLAFVAYILPGTESLFDKWKKAFIAMLVMYPLVAILFAGSRVASDIMFATSDSNDVATGTKWIYKLFALGVLAIPLFGVPWIVKFSGGVLGRIAGMVNDRNKGLVDRARKAGDKGASTRRGEMRERLMSNKLGQKGYGYEKNPDGTVKKDPSTGLPIKKSGTWAKLGRGRTAVGTRLGSAATYAARRKGDKEYDLEQRKREYERAVNEDLTNRLGETEEYTVSDPLTGNIITMTRPTRRARKLAESAAGVGGDAGVQRIQRLVSEQKRKELSEEISRQASDIANAGGFSQGSKFELVDSAGHIMPAHYDPGRALAEMANGTRIRITDQSGKVKEFDTTGEKGMYGRYAAMQQAIKVADGNAIETMLYGKKDKSGVEIVSALSDEGMAGFTTFFGDNPGGLNAKIPHLLKRDNAFTAVTAEQMADWHGTEYKAAAARIRQLKASPVADDNKRASDMEIAIAAARNEFMRNSNLQPKRSKEKDDAYLSMVATIAGSGPPPVKLRGQKESYL